MCECPVTECLLGPRSPGLSQAWDIQYIIQQILCARIPWALGWVLETAPFSG